VPLNVTGGGQLGDRKPSGRPVKSGVRCLDTKDAGEIVIVTLIE
jgi:hypothetical protein